MALDPVFPSYLASEEDFLDANQQGVLEDFLVSVPSQAAGVHKTESFAFAGPVVGSSVVTSRMEATAGWPVWTSDGPGIGAPMPEPLASLAARVAERLAGLDELWAVAGVDFHPFTSVYVDRYLPGGSFSPHTDRDCYGPVVAGISVGPGSSAISFESGGKLLVRHVVHPRSLYVFSGQLRASPITHAVSDVTGLRFGITFRFAQPGLDPPPS